MQALLFIMTLDIDIERKNMAVHSVELLCYTKRRVFVDPQIVIAETFVEKHFRQFRLSCINLSSLCQVRNVGLTHLIFSKIALYPFNLKMRSPTP
jgi:hypothetical protein